MIPPALQVRDRDGRLVPLEPDRISRALFAATEDLGRPDAFLARELTDGVLVCLTDDLVEPPAISELPELIAKYVRELGQPALAHLFFEQARPPARQKVPVGSPTRSLWEELSPLPAPAVVRRRLAEPRLRDLAVTDVFPRDVVSLHRDGLLELLAVEHPFELAASVLGPGLDPAVARQGVRNAIEQATQHTGAVVVIDGPEHAIAPWSGEPARLAAEFLDEIRSGTDLTGLHAMLHLNQPLAPPWARQAVTGPLFAGLHSEVDPARLGEVSDALAAGAASGHQRIGICWHLSAADFAGEPLARIEHRVQEAVNGQTIEFVIDRTRRSVDLGPGLDRTCPAALLFVGVHLPRLAEQIPPRTPQSFLQKLTSLARLARSAGHAKLDYLRRHARPDVTRGFLLDRARLVVVPIGLEEVVRRLVECPLADLGPGTEFGRLVVQHLRHALTIQAPHNLVAVVDAVPARWGFGFRSEFPPRPDIAGLTAWDADAPPRQQMRSAGQLQADGSGGTAAILMKYFASQPPHELTDLLKLAIHHDLQRVRLVPVSE